MLAELLSWWTEQMRDLVAPLRRRASGRPADALVLACDPGEDGPWRVVRRRDGIITHLAALSAGAADATWRAAFSSRRRGELVVIALGQPFLVRRTTLPLAAAASVDRVLRYEMDRLTPFTANDVLFSAHVASRDPVGGTLLVDLAVVPKAWVRVPMERLAALSIRPEALEQQADSSHPDLPLSSEWPSQMPPSRADQPLRRIRLDHVDPAHRARVRFAWRIGATVCAALAVAAIAVPLIRQSIALAGVEDQIAQLRPGMDQLDALRRRIAAGSAGAGQISAARERGSVALRALGVLTNLMPDDTFLTTVSLRHAHLTIEGRSAAATKLIAAMAADPELTNPSFGAPVVRADNGTDVFTIQVGFGS
jgi:general secretion pathway protein L